MDRENTSSFGACLSKEGLEIYSYLTPDDIRWLKARGWIPPHEYHNACISRGHCGICEECSCDFGLYM